MTQFWTSDKIKLQEKLNSSYNRALTLVVLDEQKTIRKAKKQLFQYIAMIENEDIKKFTEIALHNVNPRWWIDPCSGSGKYHPPEDQGDAGIVRHSIKAAAIALELSRPYCIEEKKDSIISAALLHDLHKNGLKWGESTDYTHGYITAKWIQENFDFEGCDDIASAIRYHMWRWVQAPQKENQQQELARALNPSPLERILQIADFMSSRKCVSFMPGLDVDTCREYKKFYK